MPTKAPPFPFVLDLLAPLRPRPKSMFGATAIYVGDKIVMVLRQHAKHPLDNGVWLATSADHHESLRQDFPTMRTIYLLGKEPTGWQNLPLESETFETDVERACEFILAGDPRIGKIPKPRSVKAR